MPPWSSILCVLLFIGAIGVFVPMAVWSLECAAGLLPTRKRMEPAGIPRPRILVLIPAHNESAVIGHTLTTLKPQLRPGDRVVVIADNCTDRTAEIAREAGCSVLERNDPVGRGKSYALDYAVRSLREDMPDVFVVIDADCEVQRGGLEELAYAAFTTGRPVQASYLMELPPKPSPLQPIATLAFLIKNHVRPSGLDRLGLPCFLNGSGMAFPPSIMQKAAWASGKLAEDKWLTVELLLAGHAPLFCPYAKVTSWFPGQSAAGVTQSTRWLHGHLDCMMRQGPRLLWGALRQGRLDLFAILLDLLVPPLSLLLMLWVTALFTTLVAGWLHTGWLHIGWMPLIPVAAGGALVALSLFGVVVRFEVTGIAQSFKSAPDYILSKVPIYAAFLLHREKNWVRTERDPVPPPE